MSKFVGFIIGTAEVVAGVVLLGTPGGQALGTELIIMGVTTIVSQAVVDLTMPKGPKSQNALETQLQLGEVARRAIFGKTATAGSLVDAFNYGGKYGTDHEVVIFALADHECDSLVEFYVNDLKITYTGDGAYTEIDPDADSPHLYVYFRSGTEDQTLPSVVTTYGPGWTASDNGAGICYVVVDYRADKPGNKKLAFPGGRPSFLWVVKGKKCYDPRLDDTVSGGSGAHRWTDPSTWEWSENPIVCVYNWRRGIYACDRVEQPNMLLIGRGLTATEAPPSYIFADANLCDEVMDDDLPRYTIGGIIAADEKYIDVEEKFAAACGGIIIQPEGTVQIEPAQARTPSFSFTDDDILVGSTVEWNQGVLSQASTDWINTEIIQYVSPAQKWQDHAAPVRRVSADVIADGGSREETSQLQLVTNERQASDVGEIRRKLGRLWGRGQVTLGPEFAEVEEGDWGTWTSARYGFTKVFRTEGYGLNKWQPTLSLREINSAVYDGVFGEGSSTGTATDWDQTTPPIDIGAPDSGNWSLAAVTITDTSGITTPALEITGDSTDDEAVEVIIFEYWKSDGVINPVTNPDDPTWSVIGTLPASTTKVDQPGVEGGSVFYGAVSYQVNGSIGDRLVLGPVTAGTADVSGAVNPLIDTKLGALSWKQPVRAKTTAALAANTYSNGTSGVGATLTGNANGALAAQDGVTLVANDRLLVANEATGSHNGIYSVTQVGDASHPYILTRATDADSGAKLVNATVKVSEGTAAADQEWQCTTNATITVGTTALVWAQAGGGSNSTINLIGTQIITATGAGTYTPTVGTTSIVIELVGAGGGGGGTVAPGGTSVAFGRGGGAGGYSSTRLTSNFSGASYSIGAAGTGGAGGGSNAGSAGGSTTFTTTGGSPVTYTAGGGSGGAGGGASAAPIMTGAVTAGGSVTNGDIQVAGNTSLPCFAFANNCVIGGGGGSGPYGTGGTQVTASSTNGKNNGVTATGYGAGGSGGATNGSGGSSSGGNGSNGLIIIWEYS